MNKINKLDALTANEIEKLIALVKSEKKSEAFILIAVRRLGLSVKISYDYICDEYHKHGSFDYRADFGIRFNKCIVKATYINGKVNLNAIQAM